MKTSSFSLSVDILFIFRWESPDKFWALSAILSFNNSRHSVNDVSLRLQHEIVLRVKDHLILFINAMAMGDGSLNVNDGH